MLTSITLHTAIPKDADAIACLVNSAYRGESSRKGWTTEDALVGGTRTNAQKVAALIELQNSRIEIAIRDGVMIGCVHLQKQEPDTCYLGMLTVSPELQAGGLGKRMLEHSEVVARAWNCAQMRMTVIQLRAELLAYYERRGYQKTGRAEPFHPEDASFGTPLVPGLQLLELVKAL